MKQYSPHIATVLTPPAVILNIAEAIGKNINLVLVLFISILTIAFYVVSIHCKRMERIKMQKEIELLNLKIKEEQENINSMKKV